MTETPAELTATPNLLQAALEQIRLEGAIFFRGELTENWAFTSSPNDVAGLLHPGAERILLFHIVARGGCWVTTDHGERHRAEEGDVIVIPYGDRHVIGGAEEAEPVSVLDLLDPPPWTEFPVMHLGGGGARTDLICGYLHSDNPLFDPALGAFSPTFVVRLPEGPAVQWVQASVAFAMGTADPDDTSGPSATRLPELVLIEVLRTHLANAPVADGGWLAALQDPVLAPALACLHAHPERRWTVADIASEAAVSRSLLDERFRDVLGLSPIRYLTEWRMHLAEDLLATTDIGVVAISRRVGYESEEAFSRAFKRAHGSPPGQWRAERGRAG